ncbi:MAG: 1-deoxy-D-xylulose-5-phosphate reductoisomerase [Candidatus Limnocylindrales bacterium]
MTDTPRIRVALLGSTGSIGRQALDVLAGLKGRFEVIALAAGRDRRALEAQAAVWVPRTVALADTTVRALLSLPGGVDLDDGPDALERMASRDDVDLVVVATGGVVSLRPVLAALRAGKVVATANKETLVSGGHLVMPLARALAGGAGPAADRPRPGPAWAGALTGQAGDPWRSPLAWLRPIDSEHSAIWQCLVGESMSSVERIWLTASGGPFRTLPADALARVTPEMALAHPTWRMGAKITVDSATLMNKGLEVIEADRLYDVGLARIAVAIHPQSTVHSAVAFVDGSLKAQLGQPDMRIPIQYALTFPDRVPSPAPRVPLDSLAALTFEPPDESRFPALRIAREAGAAGPRASAALIAADEVAVRRFLERRLSFPGIARLAGEAVERFGPGAEPELEDLLALDAEVRAWCEAAPADAPRSTFLPSPGPEPGPAATTDLPA